MAVHQALSPSQKWLYTDSIMKSALKEAIAETILLPTGYEMFIASQNIFVE